MKRDSFQDPAEEAARWFARMRNAGASPRQRAEFSDWLASEENSRAYSQCEAVWEEVRDAASDEAILALRREALALGPPKRAVPGQWVAGLVALAASIALVFITVPALLPGNTTAPAAPQPAAVVGAQQQTYSTQVGERATVKLADGSTVELNTDSLLRVDFSERARRLALVRGQAYFRVAHDESRPFEVEAAGRTITALGTVFDVKIANDGLQVTLVEGRVAVAENERESSAVRPEPRILNPGQQLTVRPWQDIVVTQSSVDRVTSWRRGRVIFEDERLGDVIAEINRYSNRRLVLGDPALADFRISGVFKTGSVSNFASALTASFPVVTTVDPASNTIVVQSRER